MKITTNVRHFFYQSKDLHSSYILFNKSSISISVSVTLHLGLSKHGHESSSSRSILAWRVWDLPAKDAFQPKRPSGRLGQCRLLLVYFLCFPCPVALVPLGSAFAIIHFDTQFTTKNTSNYIHKATWIGIQYHTSMAAVQITKLASVLARCMPSDVKNATKFRVKLMEFDTNLNMVGYF